MDITCVVEKLVRRYGTNNPFEIADLRSINVLYYPLGSLRGYYMKYKRVQNIIINADAPEETRKAICAHELGHAVLHADMNMQFLRNHTLFCMSRYEREADAFAWSLLTYDIEPDECTTVAEARAVYCVPSELRTG